MTPKAALSILAASLAPVVAYADQAASPPSPAASVAPLTAGSVGLLLAHPERPGTTDTLAQALHHPDAAVRMAGARVAGCLGARAVAADLAAALAKEGDVEAAQEEAQALALVGGPDMDQPLLDAATRLKPRLGQAIGEALVRARHGAGLTLIPKLRPLGLSVSDTLLTVGAGGQGDALVPLGSAAVRDKDAELWQAVLEASPSSAWPGLQGLEEITLGAPEAALREATFEHLAVVAKGPGLTDRLTEAVAKSPEAAGDTGRDGAGVGYELLRRAQGQVARVSLASALSGAGLRPVLNYFLAHPEVRPLLSPDEKKTLGLGPFPELTSLLIEHPDLSQGIFRTPSPLPTGFEKAVLAASRCRPSPNTAVTQVLYRADGRAEKIAILAAPASQACKDAVAAIVTASPAPLWRLRDVTAPDVLLLRLDDESLECAGASQPSLAAGAASEPRRIGGEIQEPHKVKDVRPVYPDYALQQRIQGLVIIEAEIAPSGCVQAMRMVHSEHAGLAAAALTAVGRWRYTPTLLDGVAVPVMMTVTVNFRLR